MLFSLLLLRLLPLLLVVLVLFSDEVLLGDCHSRLHPIPGLFLGDWAVLVLDDVCYLLGSYTLPLILHSWVFFLPQKVILPEGGYVVEMLIFEFKQTGNFIVVDLFLDKVVDRDFMVSRHQMVGRDDRIVAWKVFEVLVLVAVVDFYPLGFDFGQLYPALEIRVTECFLRGNSLLGIHLQHLLEQVQPVLINLTEVSPLDRFYVVNVWELHADKLGVLKEMLVVLGDEGPQALLDKVELIQVVFPWKKRLSIDNFCHHAADGPDIDRLVVVVLPDQQFRRPIPASCNVISHHLVAGHGPCETQVADLN